MEQFKEEWKIISNVANDEFAISNLGRIINLKTQFFVRHYLHKSRGNYYLRVALGDKKYMVHVLVAKMFLEKLSVDQCEVHHKDYNTLNPAVSNLAWVTKNYNKAQMWYSKRVEFGDQRFTGKWRPFLVRGKAA